MPSWKHPLGINVLEAGQQRISWAFDTFPKICVSFSGGKDSTVMLHLVATEAKKRNRKFAVLFIDWEAQYKYTIDHVSKMFTLYEDLIIPFWIAIPLKTVNAVSQFEPEWISWEPNKKNLWVRHPPSIAITDPAMIPFYSYAMTFEEFVPSFLQWYSNGIPTASFVGIRTRESLNRWRTIGAGKKHSYDNRCYTTVDNIVCNVFPIYDWNVDDIWIFHGKTNFPYNEIYNQMARAGVPLNKMRICEPYGPEQRRGLWLFHVIEPDTWGKVVARVSGANMGSIYAKENGNILGINKIVLPPGYTWKSFSMYLLNSMPTKTSEHYKNKIAVYLKWYQDKNIIIPDTQPGDCGGSDDHPSWKRICKTILRNDYWCRTLSFAPTKTSAYENYLKLMEKRREKWDLI
jgi:predicted phosphoadenosine phosphosulfate sulfurtransferase